jgi:hypothetical protein
MTKNSIQFVKPNMAAVTAAQRPAIGRRSSRLMDSMARSNDRIVGFL